MTMTKLDRLVGVVVVTSLLVVPAIVLLKERASNNGRTIRSVEIRKLRKELEAIKRVLDEDG